MPRRRPGLTYEDALAILGERDNTLTKILSSLRGVVSMGARTRDVDLFDVGTQLVDWSRSLGRHLDRRSLGTSRHTRTRLVEAAHGVLVVASFQSALAEVVGDRSTAIWLLRQSADIPDSIRDAWLGDRRRLVQRLLRDELPIPGAGRSFEATATAVERRAYEWESTLYVLPPLTEPGEPPLDPPFTRPRGLAQVARGRYEDGFRRLAVEVPEFGMWAAMADAAATRAQVGAVSDRLDRIGERSPALAGIADLLTAAVRSGERSVDRRRAELARTYRNRLDRPVLDLRGVSDGLELPSLADSYVAPPYRPEIDIDLRPGDDWRDAIVATVDDEDAPIEDYVAGHLISTAATEGPLVIYGQPGSGKSSLAAILAARLPEADFFPLVVPLREVPADASVYEQVDRGLKLATRDALSWATVTDALDGALPVVVLDGLDEMLQATSTDRPGYLEQVRELQRQEIDRGHPLAVVVTSRSAVAQRMRLPEEASVLHLEPFDEDHVRAWVGRWNARTGGDLDVDRVLHFADLAGQPLLLLLIALYDRRTRGGLARLEATTHAALFEAVLKDYAVREVRRAPGDRTDAEEQEAVERNLRRLGVASLAMLNRGELLLDEADLVDDLSQLGGVVGDVATAVGVVDSFYFVHTHRATERVDTQRATFEFLHSTVGEFLAARLIVAALRSAVDSYGRKGDGLSAQEPDAGLLWAATSFVILSDRPQVLDFCLQLLDDSVSEAFPGLLADTLRDHRGWSYRDYDPTGALAITRQAAYSANLVLLAVLTAPDGLDAEALCGSDRQLHAYAHLWVGQFPDSLAGILRRIRATHPVVWVPESEVDQPVTRLRLDPATSRSVSLHATTPGLWNVRQPEEHALWTDIDVPVRHPVADLLLTAALLGPPMVGEPMLATLAHLSPHFEMRRSIADAGRDVPREAAILELLAARHDHWPADRRLEVYKRVIGPGPPEDAAVTCRALALDIDLLGYDQIWPYFVVLLADDRLGADVLRVGSRLADPGELRELVDHMAVTEGADPRRAAFFAELLEGFERMIDERRERWGPAGAEPEDVG